MRGMQKIIGTLSKRTSDMEEIIYESIRRVSSTIILIVSNSKILISVTSDDFPFFNIAIIKKFIENSYELFDWFGEKFTNLQMEGNRLTYLCDNLEISETKTEKIVIISKSLSLKDLHKLRETIQHSLTYLDINLFSENQPIDPSGE